MGRETTLLALTAALAMVFSCVAVDTQREPAAPDFSYITDEQLESAMWQLAAGVTDIQAILGAESSVTRDQQIEVLAILDRMRAAVSELDPDAASPDHPQIAHNLDRFREMLAIARDSVAMEPPRYFLVGNLSGTCLACHGRE